MKNAKTAENLGKNNCTVQIDREAWVELTFLLNRVFDTLGVIAPVLELAKFRKPTEKMRHLRAVTDLAFRGQKALKAFGQRWALVQEENQKRPVAEDLEDFEDIYLAAQQFLSPAPNSVFVIAEVPHDHQVAQQIPSPDPPPTSDSLMAEGAPDLS
jgi:hypothetical protein